jgi:mannose-6-phosphate isomerase-like protein (cupin superfamily)
MRKVALVVGSMRIGLTLLNGALVFSTAMFAQGGQGQPKAPGPGQDMWITAQQMQDIMAKMPMKDGKPGAFSTRLFNASTFSCAFIRITESDGPHTHGDWSEVYIIQSGSGTMETGGVMKGPWAKGSAVHQTMFKSEDGKASAPVGENKLNQPGDPPPLADASGTSIEGGIDQDVHAGDLILVPAGTPHMWKKVNGNVVYLDIKFPKAD